MSFRAGSSRARAAVLIMTFLSAALAGIFALRVGSFQFLPWLALALGLVFAHAANNIFNDYTDFVRGVDKDNYFRTVYGAQPVASGLVTRREHLTYFFITGLCAMLPGPVSPGDQWLGPWHSRADRSGRVLCALLYLAAKVPGARREQRSCSSGVR